MRREDVEALRARVLRDADSAAGRGVKLADMTFNVEGDILDALCRRWLEVEDAPVVTFWLGDHDGVYEVDSPEEGDSIKPGQRVRLVPEAGQEVGGD